MWSKGDLESLRKWTLTLLMRQVINVQNTEKSPQLGKTIQSKTVHLFSEYVKIF